MDKSARRDISPHRSFTRSEWADLRADTPLTLVESDVARLQSLNDPVSLDEVETIYLPMSRLIRFYVDAFQDLSKSTSQFFHQDQERVPFVIGLAGSVAVGKSTTARLLQALLSRWPGSPKVDLVTTDGFLLPNAVLEAEGKMRRKGFPESYDRPALLNFLSDIKAGKRYVEAPLYSHLYYDVMSDKRLIVDQPDILILEGLNVLQTSRLPRDGIAVPFVSDFFDFSIYIDAEEDVLYRWYMERFMRLRKTAFVNKESYFHKYAAISDKKAHEIAHDLWTQINLVNLRENIFPTRPRADLVLRKRDDHTMQTVLLRKI